MIYFVYITSAQMNCGIVLLLSDIYSTKQQLSSITLSGVDYSKFPCCLQWRKKLVWNCKTKKHGSSVSKTTLKTWIKTNRSCDYWYKPLYGTNCFPTWKVCNFVWCHFICDVMFLNVADLCCFFNGLYCLYCTVLFFLSSCPVTADVN